MIDNYDSLKIKAIELGWEFLSYHSSNRMISFIRYGRIHKYRINIFLNTGTIALSRPLNQIYLRGFNAVDVLSMSDDELMEKLK